jgi:cytochrome c oxidase assembly protein subunit 15
MRGVLVANLVTQVAIVVTGGGVRLTGSGLGCPTWPQCVPGSYRPVVEQAEGIHSGIEFGNRMLTGVVGLTALAALAVTVLLVRQGRSRSLLLLGAAPLLGVVLQAVIGGITVLTHLHPATVATHFLVSMVLVAVSTALLDRAVRPDAPRHPVVPRAVLRLGRALVPVAALILVLGTVVTGSGPHSGDADTPARFGFDPALVSRVHADTVLVFVAGVVVLLVAVHRLGAPAPTRRRVAVLLAVTLTQGLVGYVQYLTGLPEALVAAHMLGAALLVVALTRALGGLRLPAAPVGPALAAPPSRLEPSAVRRDTPRRAVSS